jgi:hypothetical protein
LKSVYKSKGIESDADIETFLKNAGPKDLKQVRELVKSGYEMTIPAMVIALREAWNDFNFTGFDYHLLTNGL